LSFFTFRRQYIDYTLCNARKTLIMRFSFDKIKIRKTTQKGKREAENNISVAPTTLLILFTQLPLLAKAFALLAYYPQKSF